MVHWATASFSHEDHVQKPVGGNAMNVQQKDWGIAGQAKAVQRTLTIRMSDDMRFTPSHLEIKQGETVRLVVQNSGKQLHELVIGSQQALEEHAAQMLKFPTMEHDSPDMAHVAASKTGEIVWHFNRMGQFAFACLIPGHYQAGMTGTIRVSSTLTQNQSDEHATHHPAPSTTQDAAASKDMTEGEVRRVDLATQKIMLKHGEIKNLGMGAMTMVFQVNDPALLSQVQAGDKVRFRAAQIKGAFVVMSIEKIAP
jgi:uncharacterized cupredoxin-like copper-binding protein/Cu/Ag efflux protein CusF